MTPLRRLAVVASLQVLILLSVVGFKQYTAWTADTVVLRAATADPRDLVGAGSNPISYAISSIDLREVAGDDDLWDLTVYVELREGEDATWNAVAIHNSRESTYDGTVLIKGKFDYYPAPGQTVQVRYGIEDVFIPEGSAASLPTGAGHTVAVELKVDRFGDPSPSRFLVDGEEFDLERR